MGAWCNGIQALAEIVRVKLSQGNFHTIPYSVGHLQAIYDHKPSAYRHKFVDAPTMNLFEFGFGLSYTLI